jgi:ATP-dependent RNA helicase DeaD
MVKFDELGLKKELVDSLKKIKFTETTDIQERVIPIILEEKSVIAKSRTGSGKTGAYLIPLINLAKAGKGTKNLILLPTRELAIQVQNVFEKIAEPMGLSATLVYGGVSMGRQAEELSYGPEFVIGTPGRIKDMFERGHLKLPKIDKVVLDEADQMLDMGFYEDVSYIVDKTSKERKVYLFSATMTDYVKDISSKFMDDAETINSSEDRMPADISHTYVVSERNMKFGFLIKYIEEQNPEKAVIFSNTKSGASFISKRLRESGYRAVQIHGDLTQKQREMSIKSFRKGERFLIATDVAARGMDIPSITHIINYDLPREQKSYVHRVGRTARFGRSGNAMSIILPEESSMLGRIRKSAGIEISKLPFEGQPNEIREDNYYGDRRGPRRGSGGGSRQGSGRKRYGGASSPSRFGRGGGKRKS